MRTVFQADNYTVRFNDPHKNLDEFTKCFFKNTPPNSLTEDYRNSYSVKMTQIRREKTAVIVSGNACDEVRHDEGAHFSFFAAIKSFLAHFLLRNGVFIFMITENHTQKVLFEPLSDDVNELYILSGYATPTMLSWYIKNLYHKVHTPLRISLMIGMVPFDGISASVHEGFVQQVLEVKPQEVEKLECSYIYDEPCVHANLYIWAKNGIPVKAYTGSAFFVQRSFVGQHRQEIMLECDSARSFEYWNSQIDRSIYVQHAEVEEYVQIHPTHPILDVENTLVDGFDIQHQERYETVRLSLVTRTGEPGIHSGLNWGQREGRNPNEAYISLPSRIAKSGFFPLEKRHFTAITDDRHQLILRIEQQNDKAITTPARNSDLGEYFRNRLGLANGAPVTRADLDRYGRTDVVFLKLDEETYYMDFSVI